MFAAVLAAAAMVWSGAAQAQTLPQFGADAHQGVGSCSNSGCHGSDKPWAESTVAQNEYITWQKKDRHSKAYEVLLNDRSKRIARNLGLKDAHTAEVCLDCHADNVPSNLRGKRFQLSDGVGCEACHGGAKRWLGEHITNEGDHKANVEAGLYPTDDPVARAKLCYSCHFGDQKKFVTHRIMGAGHPRMGFELDTFTSTQPAHFVLDKDYSARKKVVANGVQTWAIGQAMALSSLMDAMADPKRGRDGIFPEFVLFDCHACHHPMSNLRWQARASTGLGPGVPRISDSNLIMLRIIATHISPDVGADLKVKSLALHDASTKGSDAMVAAAKGLKSVADKLIGVLAKHKFAGADFQALLNGVVDEGLKGEYADYAAAEQATYAMDSILAAMRRAGTIDKAQYEAMSKSLDPAFKATEKDEEYKPSDFLNALKSFKAAMK